MALSPEQSSAAACGLGSPESAKSGTPGVGLSREKAVEHARGTRDSLKATGRWLGARTGFLDGEGGSAATEFAGTRCLGA